MPNEHNPFVFTPPSNPTPPVPSEPTPMTTSETASQVNTAPIPTATEDNMKSFGAFDTKQNNQRRTHLIPHHLTAIFRGSIFAIIGVLGYLYAKMVLSSLVDSDEYSTLAQTYQESVLTADEYLGVFNIAEYQDMPLLRSMTQIDNVIGSSMPYMFKKDSLTKAVDQLWSQLIRSNKESNRITQEIIKYGYIHPDILHLMESTDEKIPIMVSLHTLETVKFATAIKVFSMLDTFLQQAGQILKLDKVALETLLSSYTDYGEDLIANYLSMCYLNPHESLPQCNQINDFKHYIEYEKPDIDINYGHFTQLLELVDKRLEQSTVPSLQINFNRFDPNATAIAFEVIINTLQEDEIAFLDKGILNPHVFILSTLVNLLKQSLFVIGNNISVPTIGVKDQNITIGNVQIPVKTSSISFNLPIQNESQREIFDFLDLQN